MELEEQAQTDGASRLQILRSVIAPLLAPGFVTATMFAFINSWNEFFFANVLIRDQDITPLSLLIVRFIGHDGGVRFGPFAAAALLATIPSLIFFALVQRRLTSGLISGAVKG
jgi:multiple sugar transport system permease protein